jgi:transcriptional regulator with XRE-family HTH domain
MQDATSLQARRIALGWSIDQLARLLDRDFRTIEAWESEAAPESARWELRRAIAAIERSRLLIRRGR